MKEKRRQLLFRLPVSQSRNLFALLSSRGIALQHVFAALSNMLVLYKFRGQSMMPDERIAVNVILNSAEAERFKNKKGKEK